MLTRRSLLHWSTGSAAARLLPCLPGLARAQGGAISPRAITANTVLFTGGGANVLAHRGSGGDLLVVDGGQESSATLLRDTITGSLGGGRISTLVNTHWHREQTGLNLLLGNRDTRIFAHENTRQWLGTTITRPWDGQRFEPLPTEALPNDTFYHYGDFNHGDTVVEYGYLRQAHTDGDMYIFLPRDNVLHTGGIVSSDTWPLMDWWTGGWIGGLVDGIETLLSIANESTVIVPASGPVIDMAELGAMRDMYAEIFATVRGRFMQASTAGETVAAKPAGAWEARYGNADQFIELSHWSLIPHYTPDA